MKSNIFLILLVAIFGFGSTALANVEDCAHALIRDQVIISESNISHLAMFMLIEKEHVKTGGGKAGLNITGFGAGQISKFRSNTSRFRQISSIKSDDEKLNSLATQNLSANSVNAYRECLGTLKKVGTRITVHDATDDAVTLTIHWLGQVGPPEEGTLDLDIGTGNTISKNFSGTFKKNQLQSRIVYRSPNKDFRVTADFGLQGDTAYVAAYPAVSIPPWHSSRVKLYDGWLQIDGDYKIHFITYDATGTKSPSHWFKFDVVNSEGDAVANGNYIGDNGREWETAHIAFDGRILDYGFSLFNDGYGYFNYSWREDY